VSNTEVRGLHTGLDRFDEGWVGQVELQKMGSKWKCGHQRDDRSCPERVEAGMVFWGGQWFSPEAVERKREHQRKWVLANPGYNCEYYQKNREARLEYMRERYHNDEEHREMKLDYARTWRWIYDLGRIR
jgi:hypothetical protein